jgi:hypothetical protein
VSSWHTWQVLFENLEPPYLWEDRFWAKVSFLGDCWEWIGASRKGAWPYGKFSTSHSTWESAHVVSWLLTRGPIPKGLIILHVCDNPPCVRPDHLRLGTFGDNTRDMLAKGRSGRPCAPGEKNSHAKLTESRVVQIRERFAAGEQRNMLALEFGISEYAVGNIINGHTWKNVGGPIRAPGKIGRRKTL